MGHPQTITKVCKDNTIADIIANDTIKQHQSHAINMQYFWIRDQKKLKLSYCMEIRTRKSCQLFYKNHSAKHNKRVRPIYTHKNKTP